MPTAICKCGRTTNSAMSNYWFADGKPTECYAAFDKEQGKWVEGCSLDKADTYSRKFIQELIRKKFKPVKVKMGKK